MLSTSPAGILLAAFGLFIWLVSGRLVDEAAARGLTGSQRTVRLATMTLAAVAMIAGAWSFIGWLLESAQRGGA